MKNKRSKKSKSGAAFLRAVAIGLLAALAAFALLLLASTALCLLSGEPSALIPALALASNYLSALVGGFFAHRSQRSLSFALCGAACGAAFMLLLALILLPLGSAGERMSHLLRFIDIPCAMLGAFLSSSKKEKKRRKF